MDGYRKLFCGGSDPKKTGERMGWCYVTEPRGVVKKLQNRTVAIQLADLENLVEMQ